MLRRSSVFAFGVAVLFSTGLRSVATARAVETEEDSHDQADAPKGSKPAKKQAVKPAAETPAVADADAKDESETVPADQEEAGPDKPAPPQVTRDAQVQHPFMTRMNGWTGTFYGFAELDLMHDSTQSYVEGSLNTTLARPNTLAGDNPRLQMTARNSRVGFIAAAPVWNGIKASGVIEADFFGNTLPTGTQNSNYTEGPLRMRLFYLKLETPIVDVIAGQDHDLFAWGGAGFYPNTPAFLPVLGEVYHRNPQIRVSKTLASHALDLEIAVAAVRPFDRDSGVPDGRGRHSPRRQRLVGRAHGGRRPAHRRADGARDLGHRPPPLRRRLLGDAQQPAGRERRRLRGRHLPADRAGARHEHEQRALLLG